jgi:hypothetical protein
VLEWVLGWEVVDQVLVLVLEQVRVRVPDLGLAQVPVHPLLRQALVLGPEAVLVPGQKPVRLLVLGPGQELVRLLVLVLGQKPVRLLVLGPSPGQETGMVNRLNKGPFFFFVERKNQYSAMNTNKHSPQGCERLCLAPVL